MWLQGREESCKFLPQKDSLEGKPNQWFQTNPMGGACGYMVLVGVPEEHDKIESIRITKQYESPLAGLKTGASLSILALIFML
mmetsp:Transcript_16371/g.27699  ORF Transcript_16371/g.27699 Transcript_16371/m.27699 type:complete len:83 (-) Transcript_16371:40-288(-)|eukprot:CAMPEP_0168617624 /NCGR_PEP_ID=MMETSP0449_2-20121227/5636_1 /TAXON_ID=1082188 /ORGANISM="Strombidium rassoulzadegani, Strain ras09" /LENGTH=82 /DNA_ID=CAMNT_0008658441 /DNA_START=378 /DNA_END=626 /DNA_ORIENTATION=-